MRGKKTRQRWPTPTSNDSLGAGYQKSGKHKYHTLPGEVGGTKHLPPEMEEKRLQMWPTPTSSTMTMQDLEQQKYAGNGNRPAYSEMPNTGSLNPTWVEWLMGFPSGWTDLEDLETP